MKPLEQQVTNLELAKELKEAEYPQEGLFYWMWQFSGNYILNYGNLLLESKHRKEALEKDIVAPTVAEGWKKLPMAVEKEEIIYDLIMFKSKDKVEKTIIAYDNDIKHITLKTLADENPANAIHKMWLYLKKEGLL